MKGTSGSVQKRAVAAANGTVAAAASLCPSGDAELRYRTALHHNLAGMEAKEIDFFVNSRRLELLDRLVGGELRRKGIEILNVASGPFAMEFYLQLREAHITSFDREPRLATLHRDLTTAGLIGESTFDVVDVGAYRAQLSFDAVIINDLFYSKGVDFYALIDSYIGYIKPGGLLYFDIQDRRAGPVWRAFGKDSEYRRYDLDDVARKLNSRGMTVSAMVPVLGIKDGIDRILRKGLWYTAGVANSYVFVARKD